MSYGMASNIGMKALCYMLCMLSFLCLEVSAGKWEVRTSHEPKENFMSIREYLGGKEKHRRRLVLRTQQERGGVYWIVNRGWGSGEIPAGSKFILEYYPQGAGEIVSHEFSVSETSGKNVVYLGLTGEDEKISDSMPSAWRIRLLDTAGKVLGSKQSYLWEIPDNA